MFVFNLFQVNPYRWTGIIAKHNIEAALGSAVDHGIETVNALISSSEES